MKVYFLEGDKTLSQKHEVIFEDTTYSLALQDYIKRAKHLNKRYKVVRSHQSEGIFYQLFVDGWAAPKSAIEVTNPRIEGDNFDKYNRFFHRKVLKKDPKFAKWWNSQPDSFGEAPESGGDL